MMENGTVRIGSIVIDVDDFDRMMSFWQAALRYVPGRAPTPGEPFVILKNPASARSLGSGRRPPDVFIRFSRFRFKEGKEAEGLDILRRHSAAIKSAPGCRDAWLAQGQHPATECVVVALFEDEDSLRRLEGRLRSDPVRGGDFFSLLSLTTQPPEVVQYEIRS